MKLSKTILATLLALSTGSNKKPHYSGQSFSDHGVFDFTIENEETSKILRSISDQYTIDWFYPHHGATFDLGQRVQIITSPEDRHAIAALLYQTGKLHYGKC